MAVLAFASFNGVPGTDLVDYTPESGGSFFEHPQENAGQAVISDQGRARGNINATVSLYHTAVPPSADYEVSATIRVFTTSGAAGLLMRMDPEEATAVALGYDPTIAGGSWLLAEYLAGVVANVQLFPQALTPGASYAARIVGQGATITAYIDGVERITLTTQVLSPGRAGLSLHGGSDSTGLHLDDWQVTADLTAAAGGAALPALAAAGTIASLAAADGSAMLPMLAGTGGASVLVQLAGGAAAAVPSVTVSGAAAVRVHAQGAVPLPALMAAGATALSDAVALAGSATLPMLTAHAAAAVHACAGGAAHIPALTASGDVRIGDVLLATGGATLPALTAHAAIAVRVSGTGAAAVPAPAAAGVAMSISTAAAAAPLPMLVAFGSAGAIVTASGAVLLPTLTAAGTTAPLYLEEHLADQVIVPEHVADQNVALEHAADQHIVLEHHADLILE